MADSSQDAKDEHKSEDTSDFLKNAVQAPIHEAKKAGEKLFGSRKSVSKQSMEPAGHMQGRHPDGDKAAQYESLSKKKDAKWGDQSPTSHYKEDPQEPAVGSDPRSSEDAEAAKRDP
ncbi:hypothetical protein WJX74_010981 [Apatococcus lobatus]|uniref:Uncharacterized protein n=2 Tax=Apatococcus TaxID=904362 RepID=A0AAW1SNR0_9CHLO